MLRLPGRHTARALWTATLTPADTSRCVVSAWPWRRRQRRRRCEAAPSRRFGSAARSRQSQLQETISSTSASEGTLYDFASTLPVVCPGCGGMSQTIDEAVAGFYTPRKRNICSKHAPQTGPDRRAEAGIFEQAMARLSREGHAVVLPPAATETVPTDKMAQPDKPLLCDRCHDLLHQSKGQSILHPSMDSIRNIIESSPHRDNHIYHVLDAADFPMSLIPNLVSSLELPRLRTQNRRSKSRQYIRGRTADISFIITRSDLLAPRKEDVDRMMPYLQEVLRDSLGRAGKNLRLGNVRCVSAKRGWWTPQVKDEIWKRGGAGWVVGKVNVGKSALFEVVYPKGRSAKPDAHAKLQKVRQRGALDHAMEVNAAPIGQARPNSAGIGDSILEATESKLDDGLAVQDALLVSGEGSVYKRQDIMVQENSAFKQLEQSATVREEPWNEVEVEDAQLCLLPPAQPETAYPHMPIVSSLPGTTASPIRIPFGNGKGELIDLPGIQRSSMETHIKPEHRSSLVMNSRIVPEQFVLNSGRSLLLGGIVRITPKTDDVTFLVYPFTPLSPHAARNDKAMAIQTGIDADGTRYQGTVENIGTDSAKKRIKSAGTFKIEWNATNKRTGSLTDRTAGKQKVDDLPFIIYSADILIEGVGWVEVACQVRNRRKSLLSNASSAELSKVNNDLPVVEVFSPKGKFISIRRPMNAYITGGPKKVAKHAARNRPRMSISYQKRMEGGRKGMKVNIT